MERSVGYAFVMTRHITLLQRRKVMPANRKRAICIDVVLLVLASLRINAASVTGVIIANEAARSSAVNVAAVDQILTLTKPKSLKTFFIPATKHRDMTYD